MTPGADPPVENRYKRILEKVFFLFYQEGAGEVEFSRADVQKAAQELGHEIRNMPDVIYAFNYRQGIPASVRAKAPTGLSWTIAGLGRRGGESFYKFVARDLPNILPTNGMAETKIPDATPGVIAMHARTDEQALLATLRYNRLIDIFTGITCYSLQSHLRTQVRGMGQLETDELYVGIDKRGAQYVLPVQAKGGTDEQNILQIERDLALCAQVWPDLICRPIAAQFMSGEKIALFMFEQDNLGAAKIVSEKHYLLVPRGDIAESDLATYAGRPID